MGNTGPYRPSALGLCATPPCEEATGFEPASLGLNPNAIKDGSMTTLVEYGIGCDSKSNGTRYSSHAIAACT